jgi:hypothetical protein
MVRAEMGSERFVDWVIRVERADGASAAVFVVLVVIVDVSILILPKFCVGVVLKKHWC